MASTTSGRRAAGVAITLGLGALVSGCTSLRHKSTDELWSESDRHFDEGRYADARPYYDELLRRQEEDAKARLMRGVAHERTGATGDALVDYQRVGEQGDARGLLYRADLNLRMGDLAGAEADLTRLRDLGLGGREVVMHLTLVGILRQKQGQHLLAAQSFERATRDGASFTDPVTARCVRDAHYNAAQSYYRLGEFARAYEHMLAYAGRAGQEGAVSGDDAYLLGLLAYLSGDFDAAEAHLARATPALVAEGAQALDDPSFGASARREAVQ